MELFGFVKKQKECITNFLNNMATKIYTKANMTQWEAVKLQIIDSISKNLDKCFSDAHLVRVVSAEGDPNTRLSFEYCVADFITTDSIMIPKTLFQIEQK